MQDSITTIINQDLEAIETIMQQQFSMNSFPGIAEVGNHILKNGGKRLRPRLLMLAARACDYTDNNAHYMAAVIELMHTATLLHDDVIDLSPLRRNQLTAHEIWGNRTSILVGDFMFTRALELTAKHANQNWAITELLARTLNQITVGEMVQLRHHNNSGLDEQTYFQIIEHKTAVLFASACETAALLSGQASYQHALKDYGICLGIAFQLIDDLLDYTSQAKTLGKAIGDDLAEGKATLPFIHVLASTNGEDRALLEGAIKAGDREHVETIMQMMQTYGSIEYTKRVAGEYIDKAITALVALPDSEYKTELESIATQSIARTQ